MAIKGVVFDNQTVTAKDHGRLFEKMLDDGVIEGCTLSVSDNTLNISAGYFICAGRLMKINSNEQLPLSGSGYIRVKVVIDTSLPSTADSFSQAVFVTENADSMSEFSSLVKEDINGSTTGVYEYAFCYLYYDSGWTVYRDLEQALNHEDRVVITTATTVSSWTANSSGTYYNAGYVYKAEITVPGCKNSYTGGVIFGPTSASSGALAPSFETGTNTITIYSKTQTTVTINRIEVHP
ncbi:MAG: hypothetical protein IJL30_07160 [Clostridia bacterium]|nr:hypothetical protein [Clostridia bacterium]